MSDKETVIVIPAHNEESWIGATIRSIRKAGFQSAIVVVDDGSTDRTATVAKNAGAVVLRMDKNVGKGHAFLRGVKYALQSGPSAVIAMDADMVNLPRAALQQLMTEATRATHKKEIRTFIAEQSSDGTGKIPIDLSGFRSFSMPAAIFMTRARGKRMARGFRMEPFLNSIFRERTTYLHNEPITTRAALANGAHAADFQRDWSQMVRKGLRFLRKKTSGRKRSR